MADTPHAFHPSVNNTKTWSHSGRLGSTPESAQSAGLGPEFLPSSTHSCPEPGLAPHSQLPQGVSKRKRLGAPDSHSSLPCVFRTPWPPLAWALTPDFALGEFLQNWGCGERGPSAQEHCSTTVTPTPLLEVWNAPLQRGGWNSLGNHTSHPLCSETVKCRTSTKSQL